MNTTSHDWRFELRTLIMAYRMKTITPAEYHWNAKAIRAALNAQFYKAL